MIFSEPFCKKYISPKKNKRSTCLKVDTGRYDVSFSREKARLKTHFLVESSDALIETLKESLLQPVAPEYGSVFKTHKFTPQKMVSPGW